MDVLRPPAVLTFLLFGLLFPLASPCLDLAPEAPSVVLLDQTTGRILFQKRPEMPIAPASLTKLMTLHLVWKALATGDLHANDLVPITSQTTGNKVPPGSSLMFLEPGQRVTVRELMLGLAVDSGNDAGLTLAAFLSGSQEAFVEAMNTEARSLGLFDTRFFDAYGYDDRNRTTAADFSRFCRFYLLAHPQSVEVLHNIREFSFPLQNNLALEDNRSPRTIVQKNKNSLLGVYPGADGLKTGFIEESGYNLAATARQGNQRLVAVLLGIRGRDSVEGTRLRTAAAARLLDYGFRTYPLRTLPKAPTPKVRVWLGEPGWVEVDTGTTPLYPLAEEEGLGLSVSMDGPTEVLGPVATGTALGTMVWSRSGQEFYRMELKTVTSSLPAPWWVGLWDQIVLFFRGLTGSPAPMPVAPHRQS